VPNDILTRAIDEVCDGTHLTADHTSAALAEIMEGRAGEVQTGAFLVALRAKGETVPELVGLARTMRQLAGEVRPERHPLVDTAGTGGGPSTYNVSTAAALIAAAAGCAVAKHGNRSATSRSGSADLLEALGVSIELEAEAVARCIDEIGFGFMFAPKHHRAMAHVVPVRKALAVHTIFNFLGPLTNPAGASRQLLGVSNRHYQESIAEALVQLGCERALVVSADDGVDEISIAGRTRVIEVADGGTEEWFVEPGDLGLGVAELDVVAGRSPEENAEVVRAVLAGEQGPARDFAVANAAAAIMVGGEARTVKDREAETVSDCVAIAEEAIDSGAARRVLDQLVERSRELAGAEV
jgi:anthranilate phosphoribosyltransferase